MKKYIYIYIYKMESLHSTAEIKHNIVNQLYFNRLKKKQIKEENLKLYN